MPATDGIPVAPTVSIATLQPRPAAPTAPVQPPLSLAQEEQLEKRMAEAQAPAQVDQKHLQTEMEELSRQLNSPERREQLARLQQELARTREQVAESLKQLKDAEFRKQLAETTRSVAEAQRTLRSEQMQKLFAEIRSPAFRQKIADAQQQIAESVAHDAALAADRQLPAGTTHAPEHASDQQLYDRGTAALRAGRFETARRQLQSLVSTYPDSKLVPDAKRAIAQSWDAEGTEALLQADHAYAAAGVEPSPLRPGITPPALIHAVDPQYTPEARTAKISGVVLVNLWVNEQGEVEHARVLRGLPHGLDEKAIEAVHQHRFKPATENGKPVMVQLNVEVNFKVF